MPRLLHGRIVTEEELKRAAGELAAFSARSPAYFAVTPPTDTHHFDFLFPTLQEDEANLLPEAGNTPELLKNLGASMVDTDVSGEDSPIPAAYTYFGQFVDHDITLESGASATMDQLLHPDMTPLSLTEIRTALRNLRTGELDLDSVYGAPAPRDPANVARMLLGKVHPLNGTAKPVLRPPGKGDDNDLPREPESADVEHDRAALTGDPRNDENLIIAQMHVAFLKAHNKLVDQGFSFGEASRILRQHYQHVVVHDFLKRIAEPAVVDDIVDHGNKWFDYTAEPLRMPLEFSVAGYRLGHTMVRAKYDFNLNFNTRPGGIPATLELLFSFTALGGQVGGPANPTLPDNWIIEWENIIGGTDVMHARKLDTNVAAVGDKALFALRKVDGTPESPPDAGRLPVRNLLRGYRLRLPTGQALAQHLGLPVMTKDEVLAAAGSPQQMTALQAGGFESRTPLWYYVLAEASHAHGGQRLGPVGSTLVAEVLIGLIRRSQDSILAQPGWAPSLTSAKPGTFELADLLRFAGVLSGGTTQQPPTQQPPQPTTYTVKKGDTLSGIAKSQLGDDKRWPQIFVLNRAVIKNPNVIFPGQVLHLPPKSPVGPIPRIYTVKKGDTLFGIAKALLGNGNRWPEIFKLNGAILTNPDRIIPGQVLVIPAK
ncbi:LysM peptidoglycan-binding domain-containing protein [Actinoplanes sp. NPDC020271]|uniref:LysM peptidoglycan-binding domain-containing protein n=1 Tax=Actinoplanes sp. NPDC020271 TaxID=3363896 RepID=UPI00379C221E